MKDNRGGHNRKSIEEHLADGTYQASRHGPLNDGTLAFRPKPPGEIKASRKSQQRWIQSAADQRAFDEGCRFNEPLGQHVVDFYSQCLCHSTGEWAGQQFDLLNWQVTQLILPLFGWVYQDEQGRWVRRFRYTYIEWPKKNGKSTIAAGIGLYMLLADGEPHAHVYSLGADKDQARIVHSEAREMVAASPKLADICKVNRTTGHITHPLDGSYYQAMSGTPRGKHGINAHCGIIDELHEWYGSGLWDALQYAYRARREPLQFVITNAGNDMTSVCYQQREKAIANIEGRAYDRRFFADVRHVPQEEADTEIKLVADGSNSIPVAERCNPGLGTILQTQTIVDDIRDKLQTPSELPNFLRLTYGIWAISSNPFLNMKAWAKCGHDYTPESLEGDTAFMAVDASRSVDMSSVCLLFPFGEPDRPSYQQLTHFWLPAEKAREYKRFIDIDKWVEAGTLTLCEGGRIDFGTIYQYMLDAVDKYNIVAAAYDPRYTVDLLQRFNEETGVDIVECPQTKTFYTAPMTSYEALVQSGEMHHNHNDCLTWQAENIQQDGNAYGKRPAKPEGSDHRKIDGIVAGIMALSLAMSDMQSGYDDPDKELVFL